MKPAALLLAAALPCQSVTMTQRWCGPLLPFPICGSGYSSANAVTPIFGGGDYFTGTLTVGIYLWRHDACHDPNSGARVVVLAGSHLPPFAPNREETTPVDNRNGGHSENRRKAPTCLCHSVWIRDCEDLTVWRCVRPVAHDGEHWYAWDSQDGVYPNPLSEEQNPAL